MANNVKNNKNTFEAKTLNGAYELAAQFFDCSANDLQIDIVQVPTKGFLGFFAKNAIVTAYIAEKAQKKDFGKIKQINNKQSKTEHTTEETLSSKLDQLNDLENKQTKKAANIHNVKKEQIFNDFYSSKNEEVYIEPVIKNNKSQDDIAVEISNKIDELIGKLCYKIDKVKVSIDNEDTVLVEFNGEDSALLIGKEGYRYKALSYILFNWISDKYGLTLRLEIAEFLQKQEQSVTYYLDSIIPTIKEDGYFKTKVLDGILIHIALEKLRDQFPDKYVAIKTNRQGEKYILINEYKK
jgi:spoIIIJ-associated protein